MSTKRLTGLSVITTAFTNRLTVILSLCCAQIAFGEPVFASDDVSPSLPPGYYVYLGPKPGKLPPRGVVLDESGHSNWQDAGTGSESVVETRGQMFVPKPSTHRGTSESGEVSQAQWDSYKYPLIKWKAHPMTSIPDGVAQLTTSLEQEPGYFGAQVSTLKYKLTLFKIPRLPYAVTVEMADENGFQVKSFMINSYKFHAVPGTALFEASDSEPMTDRDYKKVRDYTVK